jgi:hypothetical protein
VTTFHEVTMDAQEVRRRHEDHLLSLPNVTGVATARDSVTGQDSIVVYVSRKMARSQLRAADVIPSTIEGVPVHVEEIGQVTAQGD